MSRPATHLQRKLNLAFSLFFLFPTAGFIFFSVKYELLSDELVPYFFLGLLSFSFIGFTILKNLFARIAAISESVASGTVAEPQAGGAPSAVDELHAIADSFQSIKAQFSSTFQKLEKKTSEISVLKDLSELCYVTFDPEEILHIALDRALLLSNSDIGSVLTLERAEPRAFTVKATIGLGKVVTTGDRIDFETSIAKYAVLNKSPVLVEDIEKDKRFGRTNQPHYGSKSFVCMPIKTSKEIIGVLTVSSRDPQRVYRQDDVEVLTPLVSNAAFTYENLRLLRENERGATHLRAIDKMVKILNSSFRDSELLHAVLQELRVIVPFELAFICARDPNTPTAVQVKELISSGPCRLLKHASYPYENTLVEKAFQHESPLILDSDASILPLLNDQWIAELGCGTCFLTPLKTGGAVFGVLALAGTRREPFSDAQDLVNWAASGLALAIDRNRLLAAVVKRDKEIETIRQVGGALASSTFDINKVLNYTMDMLREVMDVEAGTLLFLEERELEVAVAFNSRLPSVKKFRLKLGQGIAGYVAARGEAVIVNDTAASPHFFPAVDEDAGFRTHSALCVPMISQGRVIGVIEALNKVNGCFDANDRDLLQAIAASVCIALENARLYKATVAAAEHERDVRRVFQKFVPKEVVDQIIHGAADGRPVIEELKTITLLNIDIRGFSSLARRIGPQKTVALLNRFFTVMGGIVFKHHGIVDKYLGDGFLSLFGAPASSAVDADNAVAAAVEMQQSLNDLNRTLAEQLGHTVDMGISIHTGEVVAGNIGFEKKMDYTVIGDSVNTVFRLQGLAKAVPNGILISGNTLRAVRSRLKVRAMPIPLDFEREFGRLKVYALQEACDRPAAAGSAAVSSDPLQTPIRLGTP